MGSIGANNNTVSSTNEARRMPREEAENLLNIKDFPATEMEGGLKATKYAYDLFRHYYLISRQHVRDGHEATAWSNFYLTDDDPLLTKRAARGVQTLIDKEKSNIRLDVELGIFSVDEGRLRLSALSMVQRTFNEAVKRYRKEIW